MSAFNPIPPRKAVEMVEHADLGVATEVLVDFAIAGLVKAYASVIETTDPHGGRTEVRDSRISRDLWRRIYDEDASTDVWTKPCVRLTGDDGKVSLTGIRFDDKSLRATIAKHSGTTITEAAAFTPVALAPVPTPPAPSAATAAAVPELAAASKASTPDAVVKRLPQGLPPGKLTVTVAEAGAALGLGQTTINKLMRDGTLERIKVDGRTLIKADGIRALAENGSS